MTYSSEQRKDELTTLTGTAINHIISGNYESVIPVVKRIAEGHLKRGFDAVGRILEKIYGHDEAQLLAYYILRETDRPISPASLQNGQSRREKVASEIYSIITPFGSEFRPRPLPKELVSKFKRIFGKKNVKKK